MLWIVNTLAVCAKWSCRSLNLRRMGARAAAQSWACMMSGYHCNLWQSWKDAWAKSENRCGLSLKSVSPAVP